MSQPIVAESGCLTAYPNGLWSIRGSLTVSHMGNASHVSELMPEAVEDMSRTYSKCRTGPQQLLLENFPWIDCITRFLIR